MGVFNLIQACAEDILATEGASAAIKTVEFTEQQAVKVLAVGSQLFSKAGYSQVCDIVWGDKLSAVGVAILQFQIEIGWDGKRYVTTACNPSELLDKVPGKGKSMEVNFMQAMTMGVDSGIMALFNEQFFIQAKKGTAEQMAEMREYQEVWEAWDSAEDKELVKSPPFYPPSLHVSFSGDTLIANVSGDSPEGMAAKAKYQQLLGSIVNAIGNKLGLNNGGTSIERRKLYVTCVGLVNNLNIKFPLVGDKSNPDKWMETIFADMSATRILVRPTAGKAKGLSNAFNRHSGYKTMADRRNKIMKAYQSSSTQQVEVKDEDLVLSLTNLVQAINKSKADKASAPSPTISTPSPTASASAPAPSAKEEEPKPRRRVQATKTNTRTELGTSVSLNPTIPVEGLSGLSVATIHDGNDDADELAEVAIDKVATFSVVSLRQDD